MFGQLPLTAEQRRLLGLFAKLSAQERRSLLDFAEFLARREAGTPAEGEAAAEDSAAAPLAPRPIPRPEKETVVGAMRRLRETYPMVDPDQLLDEASGLMSAHLLGGRPLEEVIDELEALFERHFHQIQKG